MRNKKTKKILTLMLAIILVFSVLAGCSDSGDSDSSASNGSDNGDEIVLGAVYPLTGPNAKTGQEFVDSIELAADIVNGKYDDLGDFPFASTEGIPSMDGAKLKIVTADSQGNPEVGATETERLITTEDLDMVLGCYQSAVTKTASAISERLGVPFVNSSSTSTELTERGFEWFFRSGPTDQTFVDDTVEFLDTYRDELDLEKIAIVAEDTEFGMLFARIFREAAEAANYTIVEDISYPASTSNVSAECIRLRDADPDVIVQLSYVSDAILFVNSYKEMGVNPKFIMGQRAGFTTPEFLTSVGDDSEYILTTSAFSLDLANDKEYLAKINELFKEKSGVDLTTEYARAMQTVFAVADAYERAGTTDKESVRDALKATDLGAEWMLPPYDGVKFDENGQNTLAKGLIIQVQDGEYKTVFPEELAVTEPVLPVPAWNER